MWNFFLKEYIEQWFTKDQETKHSDLWEMGGKKMSLAP